MGGALKVVTPGLHTTVQDLGRFGYQDIGVPVSGALDRIGLRLANALVGNPPGMAALEILHLGPTLDLAADAVRVAFAGDAEIEVFGGERRVLPAWRSTRLVRGQSFRIGKLGRAACGYLAIEGGVALAPCLGSASTYVRGAIGGMEGRALRPGDILPLALESAEERGEQRLRTPPESGREQVVRVVLGPQQNCFIAESIAIFLASDYVVSRMADRMGMRLDGPRLEHREGYNIVSDGIATGAIQVPDSGQPILLLADHQTTGGYPKIATVISSDLPAVGRRRPGDRIRFAAVEVAEAEQLRRAQEAALEQLVAAIEPVPAWPGSISARFTAGT